MYQPVGLRASFAHARRSVAAAQSWRPKYLMQETHPDDASCDLYQIPSCPVRTRRLPVVSVVYARDLLRRCRLSQGKPPVKVSGRVPLAALD